MQGTFMSSVMDFFSSPSSSLDNLQLHVSEGNTILCVHGGLLIFVSILYLKILNEVYMIKTRQVNTVTAKQATMKE